MLWLLLGLLFFFRCRLLGLPSSGLCSPGSLVLSLGVLLLVSVVLGASLRPLSLCGLEVIRYRHEAEGLRVDKRHLWQLHLLLLLELCHLELLLHELLLLLWRRLLVLAWYSI